MQIKKHMDKLIATHKGYKIWQLSKESLIEFVSFVMKENYRNENYPRHEFNKVYSEELSNYNNSKIFVAKDNDNRIIGAIRLMQWNKNDELPITRLFGLNPMQYIVTDRTNENIWHIGRFAIDSDCEKATSAEIFKILIIYAIAPICRYKNGIMFAECDNSLLKMIIELGIKAKALLNKGKDYLGSIAVPICIERDGMREFIGRNCSLALNI